jgi:tetratricopeptide (TPR) repeat protein
VGAFAAAELGDLSEADREARRAFRHFSSADDDWGRGLSLVVRGVIASGLGEPAHARDLLSDALDCAQRTSHPLLFGLGGTLRGFAHLQLREVAEAEADAERVLEAMAPHDVLPAARVGPRTLRAQARLVAGDVEFALTELGELAAAATEPSLLFPRRQAVAQYANALIVAGRIDEAVSWARRAVRLPGEDVRSRVVSQRVLASALAAAGQRDEAVAAATFAVREAYGTQQVSERAAADAMLGTVAY